MKKETSDFLKFAMEHDRIRDITEAFEEFPTEEEWHHGKIENVLNEEQEQYSLYKIGDIVFVKK